ncbi:MAG: hypothetical protein EXQ55_09765 [Acidobacteria bacterium]|nr:hypothetical protein [Acidobacteriota bacterium]
MVRKRGFEPLRPCGRQPIKVRKLGKARVDEPDQNPRSKRQRQELYWFMLISVGAALRVGEAYSLHWRDCELIKLNDPDHTEAVHMKVLGKYSRGGKREEAYGMFGAVTAFKALKAARPEAKPDDKLFTEKHREGIKELLIKAKLRTDADGQTRDAKSLRQIGISLRLELGPIPDYRDIAKWARTSPAMIAAFYTLSRKQPGTSGPTLRPPRRALRLAPPVPLHSAAHAAIPSFAFGAAGRHVTEALSTPRSASELPPRMGRGHSRVGDTALHTLHQSSPPDPPAGRERHFWQTSSDQDGNSFAKSGSG